MKLDCSEMVIYDEPFKPVLTVLFVRSINKHQFHNLHSCR